MLAERLARGAGKRVLVVDKRAAHRRQCVRPLRRAGVLVHRYGPHIFHTNSRDVFEYLSRFTEWRPYEHRVLASVDGQLRADPDQPRHGEPALRRCSFDDGRAGDVLRVGGRAARAIRGRPKTSSSAGRPRAVREVLPGLHAQAVGARPVASSTPAVTARVPARTNRDDRYFTDTYPGDAAARLHADVRADARPPEHQGAAQHRLPRRSRTSIPLRSR